MVSNLESSFIVILRYNTMMTMPGININHNQSNKDRLVAMLNALSNPTRFQIIEFISERHVCVTYEIVDTVDLAQSTVSQHLRVLRDAGLVQTEIIGPATRYSIDAESIRWLKDQIRHWMPEYSIPED